MTDPEIIKESKVPPVYPVGARLLEIQGQVILQAVVTSEGMVAGIGRAFSLLPYG